MTNIVKNSEILVEYFGYFPTFHDAEVVTVKMDRQGPNIEIILKDINTKNQSCFCLITLEFKNIVDVNLRDFNHQNVLSSIKFQKEKNCIHSLINTNFGLYGFIRSKNVIISSLIEKDKNNE